MPSNEQRRETAKRKLQRQVERRAQQARRRRIALIVGGSVAALVAIFAIGATLVYTNHEQAQRTVSSPTSSAASSSSSTSPASPTGTPPGAPALPPFAASAELGTNCQYPASADPAAKPVKPPKSGKVPTTPATISASMATSEGNIGLMLANAESPCTVNSFASLTQQGFFDNTACHRLTTSPMLGVLQCGDPKADGRGGPGYQFANEYPTDQYQPNDPAAQQPVSYPRGTLAMANAGPNTNGSQFFLVYKDSQLPPQYTVFGTIQPDGLATLDKIAGAGIVGGGEDGKPATVVTIKSVRLD